MATAELAIVLTARNQTQAALSQVQSGLAGLKSTVGSVSDGFKSFGDSAQRMGTKLSIGVTAPLALIGRQAIKTAADFESQMNVLSVAAGDAGTSIEQLRQAAIRVGADTELIGISASEAADAMTNFYKAGLDTTQIMGDMQGYMQGTTNLSGALRAAIDLAAASELDLAAASDLVVTTMSTFGLSTDEVVARVGNFVQTADASVSSVGDLAAAIQNAGPVMASFGFSLEETNAMLALLSSRGIAGSEAGTSLRRMFLNLMRGTSDVNDALADLNISLFDSEGRMKDARSIVADLSGALSEGAAAAAGMTEQQRLAYIQTLAGSDGMRALNTLLAEGVEGYDKMTAAVGDAATMQGTAAARTKGFAAAMEQLRGAVEALQINALTPFLNEVLTPIIKRLSEFAGRMAQLDPRLLKVIVSVTALVAAAGPALIAIGAMSKGVGALIGGLQLLIAPIGFVVSALGALLSPIGLVIAGIAALVAAFAFDFMGIRTAVTAVVGDALDSLGKLAPAFRDLVGRIGGVVAEVFEEVKRVVQGVGQVIRGEMSFDDLAGVVSGAFGNIRQVISDNIAGIITSVKELATQIGPALRDALAELAPALGEAFGGLGEIPGKVGEIINAIRERLAQIGEYFAPTIERLREGFGQMLESLAPVMPQLQELGQAVGRLMEALAPVAEFIVSVIVVAFNLFLEVVAAVMPRVGEIVGGVVSALTSVINGLAGVIEGVVMIVRGVLEGDWSMAWEGAKTLVKSAVEGIVGAVKGLSEAAIGLVKGLVEGVVNWFQNLKDQLVGHSIIPDLVRSILGWFNELFEGLLKIGGRIADELGKIFSGVAETVGEIWGRITGRGKEEETRSFTLTVATDLVVEQVSGITDEVLAVINRAIASVSLPDFAVEVPVAVKPSFTLVRQGLDEVAQAFAALVQDWLPRLDVTIAVAAKPILTLVLAGVAESITRLSATIAGLMPDIEEAVVVNVKPLFALVATGVTDAVSQLTAMLGSLVPDIEETATVSVKPLFALAATGATDAVASLVAALGDLLPTIEREATVSVKPLFVLARQGLERAAQSLLDTIQESLPAVEITLAASVKPLFALIAADGASWLIAKVKELLPPVETVASVAVIPELALSTTGLAGAVSRLMEAIKGRLSVGGLVVEAPVNILPALALVATGIASAVARIAAEVSGLVPDIEIPTTANVKPALALVADGITEAVSSLGAAIQALLPAIDATIAANVNVLFALASGFAGAVDRLIAVVKGLLPKVELGLHVSVAPLFALATARAADAIERIVEQVRGMIPDVDATMAVNVNPALALDLSATLAALPELEVGTANVWRNVAEIITTATEEIKSTIYLWLATTHADIMTTWSAIRDFLSLTWQDITTTTQTFITAMEAALRDGWQRMRDTAIAIVGSMADSIKGILNDLRGAAQRAGEAIGSNLAAGMRSRIDEVRAAARALAAAARVNLPGSDAQEGPLKDLTASGRALPETFAKGIVEGQQTAIREAGRFASLLEGQLTDVRGLFAGGLATTLNIQQPQLAPAMVSGGQRTSNVRITVSGNQFGNRDDVDFLLDEIDRRLRLRGGLIPV